MIKTNYVCEKDSEMAEEVCLFEQALLQHNYDYNISFISVRIDELDTVSADLTPIGSLAFVEKQLQRKGITMHPIEVPEILRTTEFLGRGYNIVNFANLPKDGYWFIKDVSKLKEFSGVIDIDSLKLMVSSESLYNHKWLYCDVLDFVVEYRFYILNDKIITYALSEFLQGYLGYFPDINKIQKMINIYSLTKHPGAYTFDVGITRQGETFLIEVHPFVSVGIYNTTIYSTDLIDMFDKGYEWYKSDGNKAI